MNYDRLFEEILRERTNEGKKSMREAWGNEDIFEIPRNYRPGPEEQSMIDEINDELINSEMTNIAREYIGKVDKNTIKAALRQAIIFTVSLIDEWY